MANKSYAEKKHSTSVVSQASYRMVVTRLEQRAYIKIVVLRERDSVWKGIVPQPHPFCTTIDLQLVSIALSVITVELTALY